MIIVLSIIWIMSMIGFFYTLPFADFFFPESKLISFLGVSNAFVIVGVPLLSVILFSARIAFKTKIAPQYKAGMWSFWLINLVSFVLVGIIISREFNQGVSQDITAIPITTSADTLRVQLAETPYDEAMMQLGYLQLSGDQLINEDIDFIVRKSDTDHFELTQKNYSRGKDWKEANLLAEEIMYDVKMQDDHTLIIPPNLIINRGTKWRGQRVELTLKVPEGKMIAMEENMHKVHNRFALDDKYDHPWNRHGLVWQMGEKGLYCPSHFKETNYKEDYAFKDFTKVQIEGRLKVNITQGNKFKVDLNGDKKRADKVEVFMFGNTLNVSANKDRRHHRHRTLVLNITMPSIESLDVEDTDLINLRGFKEDRLTIRHDGIEDIKAFVDVDSLIVKLAGRGDLDLNGSGKFLKVDIKNYTMLDAKRFPVQVADVATANGSHAKVNVSKSILKNTKHGGRITMEGEAVEIQPEEMLSQSDH